MEHFDLALVWLGFFASVFLGWYYYLQARNKERLALIEKNENASEIFKVREVKFHFPWLKLGMIVAGVGLGIRIAVVGTLITNIRDSGVNTLNILTIGLMLCFGGLGAVVAHFIEKPKEK